MESRAFSQGHCYFHILTERCLPDANDRSTLACCVELIAQMGSCSNRSAVTVPAAGDRPFSQLYLEEIFLFVPFSFDPCGIFLVYIENSEQGNRYMNRCIIYPLFPKHYYSCIYRYGCRLECVYASVCVCIFSRQC